MSHHLPESIKGAVYGCFKNSFSLVDALKFVHTAFCEESINYGQLNWWFCQFRAGRQSVERKEGSGRPLSMMRT